MFLVLLIFSSWYLPTHPTYHPVHLTNNIICGDINTNNKSPVDNYNPGEIRVSHELFNDIHLVSSFIYQVQIVSNINIQSIQGLYIGINNLTDTKYNLTVCPLLDQLSNITFPLSLLWKPDINTDLTTTTATTVEIKCIIVYNEYFWLNISTEVTSPSGCVEYFTKPYGEITSPGFPNSYPDNLNCSYVILVDRKYTLDIQINTLKVENPVLNMCQDYLEIKYDNITTDKMCGIYNFQQQRFQTKGHWAIIHFISDQTLTSNGFQLFYYANDLYDCNTTIYGTNGTITSLLYPSNYPPNLHCSTIISLPVGYRIFITIRNLTLEDNNCHDILVITDNIYNINKTWCADKQYYSSKDLMFESVSSGVTVVFSSDSHLQNKGFSLYYTAINVCSNKRFNGSEGTIKTTRYPESYMNNENCEYVINVGEESNGILLSFLDFYTESPNDEKLQDKYCTNDYIEILTEDDSYKLCGNWRGSEEMPWFRSFVNSISLRFVSDSENTKPGFHIAWKALSVDDRGSCIPTLLMDNNMCFEMIYEARSWQDSEEDCRSRGGHLATILNDLQQNAISVKLNESNCTDGGTSFWIGANDIQYEKDFHWIDGSKATYSDWFQGWPQHNSASNQPSDDGWSGEDCVELRRSFNLPTKGSRLTLNYKWNDRDCQVKNFYVCRCYNNGFISIPKSSPDCNQIIHIQQIGVSVNITSPGHPNNYSNSLDCRITVIAPPMSHLNLHFWHFHLEESIRCKYDFLSISTTPFATEDNSTFKLCGNWTGKSKLLNKRKSSNVLFLQFFADNSLTYSGFILSVSAVKAPIQCQPIFPTDILTIGTNTVTAPEARDVCSKKSSKLWQPLSKDEIFSAALQYMNNGEEADIYTIWIEGSTSDEMCGMMSWKPTQLDNHTIIPSTITITRGNCDNQHNFLCVSNCSETSSQPDSIQIISKQGNLSVPYDGKYYTNGLKIQWTIYILNHRILTIVRNIDIEYQLNCLYDYLMINDSKHLKHICGNLNVQRYFVSDGDEISVTFVSDNSIVGSGFQLEWQAIDMRTCSNNELNGTSGLFNSFNFGLPFPAEVNCTTTVTVEPNKRILLTFSVFVVSNLNSSEVGCVDVDLWFQVICVRYVEGIQYLSSGNIIKIFYRATQLLASDGFIGYYQTVNTDNLNQTRYIEAGEQFILYSYNFPYDYPTSVTHTIVVSAPLRYKLILDFLFIGLDTHESCQNESLIVQDVSFGIKPVFDLCEVLNRLGGTKIRLLNDKTFSVESLFHQIEIGFSYPTNPTSRNFNAFSVNVSSIYDEDFLNSIRHINEGVLQICNSTTCMNNGTCRSHSGGKYTCSCPMIYTGLLCQIEWCDLHHCQNGTCRQEDFNLKCDCILGSWGRYCNMDVEDCSLSVCSGNGHCTGSTNSPSCQCNSMTTGENCSSVIVHGRLTIGERLLKEPIWIGLIVILIVLLVFGIFYCINRKIMKFCTCCKANLATIAEKVDTAETTFTSEVYSVEKSLQRFTNIPPIMITRYSPVPEVDEEGGNAGTRFFASYNEAERSPISTPITTNFTQNTDTLFVDGPNVDIVHGRLSLNQLKDETPFRKQRRNSSVKKSLSVPNDLQMKLCHSITPNMVRPETQFDYCALNHTSSITDDCENCSQTSSNQHIYPKVVIAQVNCDASARHIIEDLSGYMKTNHDATDLSYDTGNSIEQVGSETRSVGRRHFLSTDHRQKLKRFRKNRKLCRSLDVELNRTDPRRISLKQECYCSQCTRTSSEYHQHRRQLPTCRDSNSYSFYDQLSRWDIIHDWCRNNRDYRHNSAKKLRDRFHRQISGNSDVPRQNERDVSNERELDVRHKRAKHVSTRRSKKLSSGTSRRNSLSNSCVDVGRYDILRKFLSQDLTDFYVDKTNINSNMPANDTSLSLDDIHPQFRGCIASVAPQSALLSVIDNDSYLSSTHKSMDESQNRIMTQKTLIDSEIKCPLSVGRNIKDSAYETKQPSVEQYGLVRLPSRTEDKRVTQRLHQVAIKLFVLQQRNINLADSRGSAVHTVCENDFQSSVPVLTSYSPVLEFNDLGFKGTKLAVTPTGNNIGDMNQDSHESITNLEV